jgi:hypothetical protein
VERASFEPQVFFGHYSPYVLKQKVVLYVFYFIGNIPDARIFYFFAAVSVYLDESVEEFSPAKKKKLPHNSQLWMF